MEGLIGASQAAKFLPATALLTRGHLVAKSDFTYGAQQHATFYYLNTMPQFNKFNAENWAQVEESIHNLAALGGDLSVTTKTSVNARADLTFRLSRLKIYISQNKLLELPDNKGKCHEFSLSPNGEIPVPLIMEKIIKLVKSPRKTLHIYGLNIPNIVTKDFDKICSDFYSGCADECDKKDFRWLTTRLIKDRKDVSKGYIKCCTKLI